MVCAAAELHDLGKLNEENQRVLRGEVEARRLPRDHVDAGTATLLKQCPEAAVTVFSHHRGLPSVIKEGSRNKAAFRSRNRNTDEPEFDWSDTELANLLAVHRQVISPSCLDQQIPTRSLTGLARRIALSCLVDADHSDTARFYASTFIRDWPPLRASERLAALDEYIQEISQTSPQNERNSLRAEFYRAARDSEPDGKGIFSCDAPVGSGKTTAVVAHLLKVAARTNRDRLIVVLPFTNIIDQTVDVLRRSLVLPGEDPQLVVTAHHHRTEFEDRELRGLAFNWAGPIVVTTAVQFFQTISGASTGALRKLHRMTNAVIMIDEAHGCIPVHLWKQQLEWISELANSWGAYFVLASGSLCEFWRIRKLTTESQRALVVPPVISEALTERMRALETTRYRFSTEKDLTVENLIELIQSKPGPRLVVVNTVEGAARIARALRDSCRSEPEAVLHLSTALAPRDRTPIISNVKSRLAEREDTNWTLVATSCVEAGMDFSFKVGFRERASFLSLIQLGGRVNRSLDREEAELIDFVIDAPNWPTHPDFKNSQIILSKMIAEGKVRNNFSTESIERLLSEKDISQMLDGIFSAEKNADYPTVADLCRVITTASMTVIVDPEIAARARIPGALSARDIQDASVQIFFTGKKVRDWGLTQIGSSEELFAWKLAYDPNFLGYMAGVLDLDSIKRGDTILY